MQVLKVIPYSSIQLASYEMLKRRWGGQDGKLPVSRRLAAGACAGMIATLVSCSSPCLLTQRWFAHTAGQALSPACLAC